MPLRCNLQHRTVATTELRGKLRLAARHEAGWTFPRELMEVLEAVDEVPLPARCGFWAVPGGVAVEVVVRADTLPVRRQIEASLAGQGVPVQDLHLVTDRRELRQPL